MAAEHCDTTDSKSFYVEMGADRTVERKITDAAAPAPLGEGPRANTLNEAELGSPLQPGKGKNDKEQGSKREAVTPAPYWQLYSYADNSDKILIFVGVVSAAANGAILPLFTVVFGSIINTIGKGQYQSKADFQHEIDHVCLYFVYLACAAGVASYFEISSWMLSGARQARRIKEMYLKAVLRQNVAFFDIASSSGELSTGVNEDTVAVQNAIGEKVGNTIHNAATFITGIIIAFIRGWSLTLVMLALVPAMALLGLCFATMIGGLQDTIFAAYAGANSLAQEALGNMRTVSSFNGQQRTTDKYSQELGKCERVQARGGVYQGLILGSMNSFFMFSYALALWYGSTRILAGQYDGGQVLNVIFAALIGGLAIGQAAPNIVYFISGQAAFARIKRVLDRKPDIDEELGGAKLETVVGHVELRDVVFQYPARPDVTVLHDFSLDVPPGTTFALVGQSGSGKSTVVQLVERFYDPMAGRVLLDGHDIWSLDLAWYRSHVGLVSQEPTLFASNIFSNIAYGRKGATSAEVEEAARVANAHDFISALPLGYETPVGEKGIQLSGGQKQRVAIARAILKNPRILLLDEATSALDNKSERLVQLALDRLIVGRTTIVVAHRLSTIIHSHQIAVVREGKIVEQGSHADLISRPDGAYSVLVGLQMSALGAKAEDEQDSVDEDKELLHKAAAEAEYSSLKAIKIDPELALDEAKLRHRWWHVCFGGRKAAAEKTKSAAPKVSAGFFRLAGYNRPEWPYFFWGGLGSIVLGCVMPFFALALSSITGAFFSPSRAYLKEQVAIWCGVFAAIGAAALVSGFLQGYCFTLMGARLTRRIRIILIGCLMKQEMAFFDKSENSSGALVARLGIDTAAIRGAVGDQVGVLCQNLATFVAGFVIAFSAGWKMTLVIVSVLPLLIFASYMETRFLEGFSSKATELYSQANQMASDAFGACRTVAAFNLRAEIYRLYCSYLDKPEKTNNRRAQASGIGYAFSQFIMFNVYALGFWYGGTLVADGQLSFTDMMKVFLAILLAAMGIAQARVTFPDISKASGAVQRVFAIIDRPSAIDSSDPGGDRPAKVEGNIALRGVKFVYPERPDVMVFQNFSLTVDAGRTVALCGQSGSGKSSIVALILRFYDPLSGCLLLDGVDIRQLNLVWLRQQMSLVAQEPHLFTGTIKDNILYGREDATDEEIREAARSANALDFIEAAPAGFNTPVGDGGIQLSGGQRQRIAIARAIVRQPQILLLDEATSALDASSERVVQEALDRLSVGRTTVIVAHRLSTIRNANKIAVLQEGKILEQGSHDDLMRRPRGAYRALISQQQQST